MAFLRSSAGFLTNTPAIMSAESLIFSTSIAELWMGNTVAMTVVMSSPEIKGLRVVQGFRVVQGEVF